MIAVESICPPLRITGRARLAAERAIAARASLSNCRLCAWQCGVNRLAGARGPCRAGPSARVFSAQVEVTDELLLVPTYAVALSGCDLRCDFCITGAKSWNPAAGQSFQPRQVAVDAINALARGARTIMILGGEPTLHLPDVLEFVAALPDAATLVWKTNLHASSEALQLLEGIFNFWVGDFKFGNDRCAERLAKAGDYLSIVQDNLQWAGAHTQLIVRHLLMPGHLECCWVPIAEWLADELPEVRVSLHGGFWPGWHSSRHPQLTRVNSHVEIQRALDLGRELGLHLVE